MSENNTTATKTTRPSAASYFFHDMGGIGDELELLDRIDEGHGDEWVLSIWTVATDLGLMVCGQTPVNGTEWCAWKDDYDAENGEEG